MINYALAKEQGPKLKAALTRAQKKTYADVLQACKNAVASWRQCQNFFENSNLKGRIAWKN